MKTKETLYTLCYVDRNGMLCTATCTTEEIEHKIDGLGLAEGACAIFAGRELKVTRTLVISEQEPVSAPPAEKKPRRRRRTKLEMEQARAAEAAKKNGQSEIEA